MRKVVTLVLGFFLYGVSVHAQTGATQMADETMKRTIMQLEQDLYEVKLNLNQAQNQLKNGILVATIGYSVTILGGQLLGSNPEWGRGLLYAGGAIGIAGTVVLVKGFNKISLGPPAKPRSAF
ncbi:hypothetical protein [Mongoliitalea daihaiensis]|uniref:hypothetical protein n=1 Tax=Mongoliitalea daihaiensis TaxID=2782006 RepID=UPI001F27A1A2|nr:hypothetical protein [Mongoliitalea daihaiensis]UJP64601.1 hypothetical protein IPZ59_17635 [Mongoliitalea daihaiensis]